MSYDAAILIVWGVLATEAMNASYYLHAPGNVWGDSIGAVALGVVMLLAAFLAISSKKTTNNIGGVLGTVCSVLGFVVAYDWLTSVNYSSFYTPNFVYTYTVITLAGVLMAGFPLGLMGSLRAFGREEKEGDALTASKTESTPTA